MGVVGFVNRDGNKRNVKRFFVNRDGQKIARFDGQIGGGGVIPPPVAEDRTVASFLRLSHVPKIKDRLSGLYNHPVILSDAARINSNVESFRTSSAVRLGELSNESPVFDFGYPTDTNTNAEPQHIGEKLRDACFVAQILKLDSRSTSSDLAKADDLATKAKAIILQQCRGEGTDYANTSRYFDYDDQKYWVLCEFQIKYNDAYRHIKDFVISGLPLWSTEEKAEIHAWIYAFGKFFATCIQANLSAHFPQRLNRNYLVRTNAASNGDLKWKDVGVGVGTIPSYTHVDAAGVLRNRVYRIAAFYNNRRSVFAYACANADVTLRSDGYSPANVLGVSLQTHAELYVEEWLKYSVYEDGMQAEHERDRASEPHKGHNYIGENLQYTTSIAEIYRVFNGSTYLYDYNTTEGLYNSSSTQPKNLKLTWDTYFKQINRDVAYYFTDAASGMDYRQESYRFSNVQTLKNYTYVSEIRALPGQMHWKDPYFNTVIGKVSTSPISPTNRIGSAAGAQPWGGAGELYPGFFLQFWDM